MRSSSKPRVLYLVNSLVVGGAEVGLANMVNRGLFEDCDLSIVTIWPNSEEFLTWKKSLRKHIDGSLLEDGARDPISMARAFWNLINIIRKEKPKIIIGSLPQSVIMTRLAKLIFPRLRVITFEHNERLGSPAATILFRLSSWLSSAFWSDSSVTTISVRKRHWYRRKVPSYIVSLQDLSDALSVARPEFQLESMRLLFVGRLTAQKNILNTVIGFGIARNRGVPVVLDIVGDGEQAAEVKNLVFSLGLSSWVNVHGTRLDWPAEFGATGRLGILASEREGLSITGLQLLALGFPLVTTGSGEVARYLEDDVNGFLVSTGSPESIAQAIGRAWKARARWDEMALAARRSAIDFDISVGTAEKDALAKTMLHDLPSSVTR